MSGIANKGFGGKKLSNKRRRKRGVRATPIIATIVVACAIYFFFFSTDKAEDESVKDAGPIVEVDGASASKLEEKKASQPKSNSVVAKAEPLNKSVKPLTAKSKAVLTSLYRKAKSALSQGDLILARKLAFQVLNKVKEGTLAWDQAANIIGTANTLIFTTDYVTSDKVKHIVRSGDSLDKLVKKYCTTLEAIQKANHLSKNSSTIRVGQCLTIFKGDWSIRISKSKFRLYLYNKGKLFKVYKIATGKGNKTPEGKFVIAAKIKEPEWTNNGVKYPYGTPENVLGTRWMKLRAAATNPNKHLTGYGIHGTWEPSSIGKMASNGCIRMVNKDVEELFSIIPKYTNPDGNLVPVNIER